MPERLFLLHDDQTDLGALAAALRGSFDVVTIHLDDDDGLAGLSAAPAVLDVDLSDGRIVKRLQKHLPRRGAHPRMMVVTQTARSEHIHAGVFGASELIHRPYVATTVAARVERALRLEGLEAAMGRGVVPSGAVGQGSILVAEEALGSLFAACLDGGAWDGAILAAAGSEITAAIRDVGFDAWMSTVRRHHDGTYQHCMLVTGIAVGFGTALGLSTQDVERLAEAGLAHDAGKARVPVEILDKPGRLSDEEFAVIRRHPEWGYDFLRGSDRRMDRDVLDVVLHHHEALDGTGYPHGLAGSNIGDMTRILTVCDIYGALSERRAYKPPMPKAQIMAILGDLAERGKIERALVRVLGRVVATEAAPRTLAGFTARRRA